MVEKSPNWEDSVCNDLEGMSELCILWEGQKYLMIACVYSAQKSSRKGGQKIGGKPIIKDQVLWRLTADF